jgi:L-ascorbate metabolism protein UlaG (beta-lactamase superfamily)
MRLTKLGHACVRIEYDGQVLVVDPGAFTDAEAVDGATAVLVTHQHFDHLHVPHLARTDAPVYSIESVRSDIAEADPEVAERVQAVSPGQRFDAGLPVTAVGELHAVVHPDLPRMANSGFVIDMGGTRVYHPGDSFTLPGGPVDVLLLPVSGPWSKLSEVADFGRAVGAPRSVAIHDGLLNDTGLQVFGRVLGGLLEGFELVAPGSDLQV